MTRALASRERLRRLFSPAGIALVGASDTSGGERNVHDSLRTGGFQGRFVPVHPRPPTWRSCPSPTHAVEEVPPPLRAVEVNPLWCGGGDRVEGLDVLVVTGTEEL